MGPITKMFEELNQANSDKPDPKEEKEDKLGFRFFPTISEVIDRFVKDYLFKSEYKAFYKIDRENKTIGILIHQPATNVRNFAQFSFRDLENIDSIAKMPAKDFRDKIAYEFVPDDREVEKFTKEEGFSEF